MKCHYTYMDGKKYLIPHCMSVVHSDDIQDCTCASPMTECRFEKFRFDNAIKEKNDTIKCLTTENKRLMKELDKAHNKGEAKQ